MTQLSEIEGYVKGLHARHDEPVLLEMEEEANRSGFPIVGRLVGVVLEMLARSIGARRVFEMGSGFGYSAYWFSRAVGRDGEVVLTDNDAANEARAVEFLARAGLDSPVRFEVGDSMAILDASVGQYDVIFCDVDKDGYPRAWELARERIRVGGLYVCDNTLGFGDVSILSDHEGSRQHLVEAIRRHNEGVFSDPRYLSTILPIRDGVLVALRLS